MLNRLPLDKALRVMLAGGTGKPVGLGTFPTDPAGSVEQPPFSVLYPLDGAYSGPGLSDWTADAVWTYQVTVVAARADQVAWLGDRVRQTVLGHADAAWSFPLDAPGLSVQDREHTGTGPLTSEGTLVSYAEIFAFSVTAGA